ncbi:integrase catalytic domain-containing protein [Alkalihalobacterium bogoriense]|uniref:integrase catalytic domain-containing protein n=1 Tax=Alkalihalobacterium bogoriense TaxID=246272 RepID=UPI00047A0B1E|nr:Mu transposase C-terminal domain-containing protein [Alkalihalobacterium bogoriense]
MELFENTVLQYTDGKTIRVIYNNRISSIIYVIDLNNKRWPYVIEKQKIQDIIDKEEITILKEDEFLIQINEEILSEAIKSRRDRAWQIVSFILEELEEEDQIFNSKYREKAIKKALGLYQVNYSTVKNYLLKYWQGGMIKNALIPRFYSCGSKGKEKNDYSKKRGRPRKNRGYQGINIDAKVKKYFKIGLNRYYYTEKQNSLRTAYELTLRDFFTVKKIDESGKTISILKDISQLPTYAQFLYWFNKFNDTKKEVSNRNGTRVYYQKFRNIIGNSTQDAGIGPATLWQIDSTPLDIHCVSSVDRNVIVGKPLLHLVVDVYSRQIVGFSLSFESLNAYSGAMLALLNSMTCKKEFCKQYGVMIEDEWNVACIPQKIFTDRGELDGKQIEGAIEGLGISVQNSPPYRPELKGIVESLFNQINMITKPKVDGAVISSKRIRERGEIDFRLKANLTIAEVTAILIKIIIFYNNFHVIEEYPLTEHMIEKKVEKVPRKIWEYGLKHQKGQLRVLPEQTIRMHLLPTDSATVTSKGVKYKKMYYASEYSLKHKWFEKARLNGSYKIKIWFDPMNLTNIYFLNDVENTFQQLTLVDHLSKFKDKTIDEAELIMDYEELTDRKVREKELKEKMKLFDDIEQIVTNAKMEKEKVFDSTISKTKKLSGIKENQRIERAIQRIEMNDEKEVVDNSEIENDMQDDDLEIFKRLYQNRIDKNE